MRAEAAGARPIFQEIKANNDRLEDPSVKSGLFIMFRENDKFVDLPTALDAVSDPSRSVTMIPHQYKKPSKMAVVAAMCLGGSVPYLNGVALAAIAPLNKGFPIQDAAQLEKAWADTQLY